MLRLHEEEKTLSALQVASSKPEPASPSAETVHSAAGQPVTDVASCSDPVVAKGDGRTLVEHMFGGRLSTAIRCLKCHSLSEKEEPFRDLSLAFCPSMSQPQGPTDEYKSSSNVGPCQGAVNGGSESSENSVKEAGADRPVAEPALSVPDLVDYFLAPEILENDNCYFCEHCCSLQRAEKVMRVVAAPEYLILTLLRFSYDATCHVRRKIMDNVGIPLRMCLPLCQHAGSASSSSDAVSPLSSESPNSGENLAKKLKPSHKEEGVADSRAKSERTESGLETLPVPYVLSSVVMHSGMSSESGHYYSYGRNVSSTDGYVAYPCPNNLEGSSLSQEETGCADHKPMDWFLFNDSRVTFTNFQSLQNVTSRFPKDTAYVLIYRKQEISGQQSNGGAVVNGLRLNGEPPLQKELMDAITKDNKLFLQVGIYY